MNEGYYDEYLLQGTLFKARTLSTMDGTVTTRCKVTTYAGSPRAGRSCSWLDDCETGANCIEGSCRPVLGDCAAQKARYRTSANGVYWLDPDGKPYRLGEPAGSPCRGQDRHSMYS
jgi:hypothetical protein